MSGLKLLCSWVNGYDDGKIAFISNTVLLYRCGNSVKFLEFVSSSSASTGLTSDSAIGNFPQAELREQSFSAEEFAPGISLVAAHPYDHSFAIATSGSNPAIFIYSYPFFKKNNVLTDGSKFEYSHMVFSSSIYLAAVSGIPDFQIVLWNTTDSTKLLTASLPERAIPSSVSFNPSDWRQLAFVYSGEANESAGVNFQNATGLWLGSIEQCDKNYSLRTTHVWLPAEHAEVNSVEERKASIHTAQPTRGSTRIMKQGIEVPKTAIAGLVDQQLMEDYEEYQRKMPRMVPLSHAWSDSGELLVGCRASQLVRVEGESGRVYVLYNPTSPPAELDDVASTVIPAEGSQVQRATVNATPTPPAGGPAVAVAAAASDTSAAPVEAPANTETSGNSNQSPTLGPDEELAPDIAEAGAVTPKEAAHFDMPQEPQQLKLQPGALATLVYTKNGIYNAGKDGKLRVFRIKKDSPDKSVAPVELSDVVALSGADAECPISSLSTNDSYTSLAIGSRAGGVAFITSIERSTEGRTRVALTQSCSPLVGVATLAPGTDYAVSLRESGLLQVWNLTSGRITSSIAINYEATALACSPLSRAVCVGTRCGRLVFVDFSKMQKPRVIHAKRMFREAVKYLEYDKFGDFLATASSEGRLYILSGTVSRNFAQVLGHTSVPQDIRGLSLYRENDSSSLEVVVTARIPSKNYQSESFSRFLYFRLPNSILSGDAPEVFANASKRELKNDQIGKFAVNVTRNCVGAALTRGRALFTIDQNSKQLLKIQLPAEVDRREPKMVPIVALWRAHEIATDGGLKLAFNGDMLLSYASDGQAIVRVLSAWSAGSASEQASTAPDETARSTTSLASSNTIAIKCADHLKRGIRNATLSRDGSHLLVCGYDAFVYCYKWSDPTVADGVKDALAAYLQDPEHSSLSHMEDDSLQRHAALGHEGGGGGGGGRASAAASHAHTSAQDAAASGPLYAGASREQSSSELPSRDNAAAGAATSAPGIFVTPLPVAPADPTWLEQTQVETIYEEDKQHGDFKLSLRKDIQEIRKALAQLTGANGSAPELEKLAPHEFDLDSEEQARADAEADAAAETVRQTRERYNLSRRYVRDLIKFQCYDEMAVKGKGLKAFIIPLEVHNYALKPKTREDQDQIQEIIERRKVELAEKKVLKEISEEKLKKAQTVEELIRDKFNMKTDEEPEEEQAQTQEKAPKQTLTSAERAIAPIIEYLYDQFELGAREQKLQQIVLLHDMIYRIKDAFNREFDEAFTKKEQEMMKIRDKNRRINKILSDLDQLNDLVPDPELSPLEKPEKNFVVDDSEIKAEKYLTPEQRKKLEAEQRAAEEAAAAARADNWRERGLDMMMGGVLEVKREDELKKDIPLPGAFMLPVDKGGRPPEEWTEEEQRLVKDYERRCKELQEERDKFRKQLETELKKLQGFIEDGKVAYDEQLNNIFLSKIKTEMLIYEIELRIERLQFGMLFEEELELCDRALQERLGQKRASKLLTAARVAESKRALDAVQSRYETMLAEDKILDKSFKKDFSDLPNPAVELLLKQYKRKPKRTLKSDVALAQQEVSVNNPYYERPATARVSDAVHKWLDTALSELDAPANMPEHPAIDARVWKRLCDARRQKQESELALKHEVTTISNLKAFQQARNEEDERVRLEIAEIERAIEKLHDDRNRFMYNLDIQLNMKQGQVEVDTPAFVPDFRDCVLIDRKVVEELNSKIQDLGSVKIKSMEEGKDFKRGIVQLQWERQKMEMEMEDLLNKKRDIQMMKVTREIQAYLSAPEAYDAKISSDIQKLEMTVQNLRHYQKRRVEELERQLGDLEHDVNVKQSENERLGLNSEELNVLRSERYNINQVNAAKLGELDTRTRRYDEIVQRRRLIELAKQQAQEIAVLRAEVERLRMRTFPALVQLE